MNNRNRIGRFTSSGIGALMSAGKPGTVLSAPALTYIKEKNYERMLGRSLNSEASARPTTWGNFVERRVLDDLLPTLYRPCSQETIEHPTMPDVWAGSPDAVKEEGGVKTVVDIKCPFTMKSFCQLVEHQNIESIRQNHKEGDTYYWQLVSNAILTGATRAELIIYCPYIDHIPVIREMTEQYDGDQNKIAWINWAHADELPYITRDGMFKDLNIISFDIPEDVKAELTHRVELASKLLIPYAELTPAPSTQTELI